MHDNRNSWHSTWATIGRAALSAGLILLATSCDRTKPSGRPRYPVHGVVTVDGKPLNDGRIHFVTRSLGLFEGLAIKNGAFRGEVAAGERRVEFSVLKEVKYTGPTLPGVKPPETETVQSLPAEFNEKSTFMATVTPDGPNEFTFELKSN